MWALYCGSHYTMDFQKYETSKLSKILKILKKILQKTFALLQLAIVKKQS